MTKESVTQQLEKLIPQSLDDVIRANRDKCRLALATDDEMTTLETGCSGSAMGSVRHTLTHWQVVMIHVSLGDGTRSSSPRLAGRVQETGQSWITSHVIGIDSDRGFVQTTNSTYRVIGSRVAEKELDLLHICASLNYWGLGAYLGVPEFFL